MIDYICDEIERTIKKKITTASHEAESERRLRRVLENLNDSQRICVIFDEIEYISPIASRDPHWRTEFVDFWQTMWSIQSEIRKLSFIVSGVNPYVTEVDLVDGIQNPMFGIVQGIMLTGLDHDACVSMITRIGRQMGLHFEQDALDYLHSRYGGHPLLTRMACSFANSQVAESSSSRPCNISLKELRDREATRDSELSFYCRHIVSELELFYPDEYKMLTMLSRGEIVDFVELSAEPEWIRHLKGYGILEFAKGSRPTFKVPALQRYIANEAARLDGTREPRKIIPTSERSHWLTRRKRAILAEFKSLLHELSDRKLELPFRSHYLPEADRIESMLPVGNWGDFQSMINNLNMCLVETIETEKGAKYFFGKFKSDMPTLFHALSRIRVYRNNSDHLRLNKNVEIVFNQFINVDLMNKPLSEYKEPWFLLQQIVLDELLAALLFEIDRLS